MAQIGAGHFIFPGNAIKPPRGPNNPRSGHFPPLGAGPPPLLAAPGGLSPRGLALELCDPRLGFGSPRPDLPLGRPNPLPGPFGKPAPRLMEAGAAASWEGR
eukprot:scaffold55322_cov42-Prasinocladus_malaysianus.AAC.2